MLHKLLTRNTVLVYTSASCSDASDSARLLLAREMRGLLPCTLRMDPSLAVLPPWCRPSCTMYAITSMHDLKDA